MEGLQDSIGKLAASLCADRALMRPVDAGAGDQPLVTGALSDRTVRQTARLMQAVINTCMNQLVFEAFAAVPTRGNRLCSALATFYPHKFSGQFIELWMHEEGQRRTIGGLLGSVPAITKVILVDDWTRSGRSFIATIDNLHELGIEVVGGIVVGDSEYGARERIEGRGITFYSIFTTRSLLDLSVECGARNSRWSAELTYALSPAA